MPPSRRLTSRKKPSARFAERRRQSSRYWRPVNVYAAQKYGWAAPNFSRRRAAIRLSCAFLNASAFDDSVSRVNSTLLFNALKNAGVRTELHLYDRGGHGYGLRRTEQPVTAWADRLAEWLKTSGLLQGKR